MHSTEINNVKLYKVPLFFFFFLFNSVSIYKIVLCFQFHLQRPRIPFFSHQLEHFCKGLIVLTIHGLRGAAGKKCTELKTADGGRSFPTTFRNVCFLSEKKLFHVAQDIIVTIKKQNFFPHAGEQYAKLMDPLCVRGKSVHGTQVLIWCGHG